MLNSLELINYFGEHEINFYAGVPDSLLKDFCATIDQVIPPTNHLITANEGSAIALAAGYYMATKKLPLVYMQNSGLGNAINPLTSLASSRVYGIPMILMIGWRGEPNVSDEPQHQFKGEITKKLLEVMNIKCFELPQDFDQVKNIIGEVINLTKEENNPVALLVKQNSFKKYQGSIGKNDLSTLTREEAIKLVLDHSDIKKSLYLGGTGKIGRELYELRENMQLSHETDFLNVGSMGHLNQIALGVALNSSKTVYCLDGDGSMLMHLGSLGLLAKCAPRNLIHIVLNNGSHESVGGQATLAHELSLTKIASSLGFSQTFKAQSAEELIKILKNTKNLIGPIFIEVLTSKSSRNNLIRPKESPQECKNAFMKVIN